MAKKSTVSTMQVPGITNYAKLRNANTKATQIHRFNPFMTQMYAEKAHKQSEADSLDARYLDEDIYSQLLSMQNTGRHRNGKRTTYYGLNSKSKRDQLIRLSVHDVVDEVLTKLTDEVVVATKIKDPIVLQLDTTKFDAQKLDKEFQKQLQEYAIEQFGRIMKMYGFGNQGTQYSLWNRVYLFLIEGSQSYEMVWDDLNNPKKIIAIHEIDPLELEQFYAKGVKYWKHHRTMGRKNDYILMYDSQIIKIDWSDASPNNRVSYLEHLLKSFNDLRIMDESTLISTVTNSVFRMIVKVPTAGKGRIAAAQTLAETKHMYNDDIQYDAESGELNINGTANQMMMKTYWMSDGDSGTPEVQTVGNDGGVQIDTNKNEYFSRRFYQAARMPYSRFDSNSSDSWNMDTRSQLREEITFGRFVSRIQDIVQMLILKPLYMQLAARFPEIKDDDSILDAIKVQFNSYSVFEELMQLDVLKEKVESIGRIREAFTSRTPDGEELKYWSDEFLINEYLPEMNKQKLDLNAKMAAQERENMMEYQLRQYLMKTKYDPQTNFDPETGLPISDLAKRIEDEIQDKSDIDNESSQQSTVKDEVDDDQTEVISSDEVDGDGKVKDKDGKKDKDED